MIEIRPTSGWQALNLREVWRYRELLQILIWRDVKVRYRQTFLGVLWVVAQPLLTMLIFTLLFNRVAKISAGNVPYSLFVMAALVPWTFLSSGVSASSNSLIGSSHLISKVYFPRIIVPAAAVLSGMVDLVVTLGIVLAMYIRFSLPVTWHLLFLPLVTLVTTALAIGVGLWLSALNVEYRDVRIVIPFLTQIWMYGTPVAYPQGVLPEKFRWLVLANPATGVVESFRASLLGSSIPWSSFAYSTAVSLLVLISGAFYFRRVERLFADVL